MNAQRQKNLHKKYVTLKKGKNAIIFDDEIDTAGSKIETVNVKKNLELKNVC